MMSCDPKKIDDAKNNRDIFVYKNKCRGDKDFVPNQLLVYGEPPIKEGNIDTIITCPCGDSLFLVVYGNDVPNFEAEEERIKPPANKEGGISKNFIFDFPEMKDTSKINGYLKGDFPTVNTMGKKVSVLDTGVKGNVSRFVANPVGCTFFDRPDKHGHGSFVSYILLQTIARAESLPSHPPYNYQLVSYNVTNDNGDIDLFNVMCAMKHAAEQGTSVINMSFGAYCEIPVFRKFTKKLLDKYPNLTLVTSSGNNDVNLDTKVHIPSTYYRSFPGRVIQVAALVAPAASAGTAVWEMWPSSNDITKGNFAAQGVHNFEGEFASGTSFAAPIVSGLKVINYPSLNQTLVLPTAPAPMPQYVNQFGHRIN